MLDIFAMEEKLTGEYKRAFSKISMYGTMTPLERDMYEDRVLNIYDTLMAAQKDNKPVERIIGRDIEAFCKSYYENQDLSEWMGNIFNRVFKVMLVLLAYSVVELVRALADRGGSIGFADIEINAAPILVGLAAGFIIIGIEALAKRKLLLKTDKIKSSVYAVGILVIFLICAAVGVVLFGDIDSKLPVWIMLAASGGYSVMYVLLAGIFRYRKTGTLKKLNRINRQELKEFNKELTLEYDIRTSAKGMAEQFDKMKRKYLSKGKPEPKYTEFMKKMYNDHKFMRYAQIFFVTSSLGICVVNIAVNIGSEDMLAAIIASVIVLAVNLCLFRFTMGAIREVEAAQCVILKECEERGIDIYEYVADMQKATDMTDTE